MRIAWHISCSSRGKADQAYQNNSQVRRFCADINLKSEFETIVLGQINSDKGG